MWIDQHVCLDMIERGVNLSYTDRQAAEALTSRLGHSRWAAVTLARAFLAALDGGDVETLARMIAAEWPQSLKEAKQRLADARSKGFASALPPRTKKGSAENPITKLFPATITEQRFIERLDQLTAARTSVTYSDERESEHGFVDFTLREGAEELPINIKNAGTRFLRAQELVKLSPDDCLPIAAYKAYGAVEKLPSLLYVISVDYNMTAMLDQQLPKLLDANELIVWQLINNFSGYYLTQAEDLFVFETVKKHWGDLRKLAEQNPFHVISARRAIRILQTKPERTPGIGLRAWGTSSNAEVNVHISISQETTPWDTVSERITRNGVVRKREEVVFDPEI